MGCERGNPSITGQRMNCKLHAFRAPSGFTMLGSLFREVFSRQTHERDCICGETRAQRRKKKEVERGIATRSTVRLYFLGGRWKPGGKLTLICFRWNAAGRSVEWFDVRLHDMKYLWRKSSGLWSGSKLADFNCWQFIKWCCFDSFGERW